MSSSSQSLTILSSSISFFRTNGPLFTERRRAPRLASPNYPPPPPDRYRVNASVSRLSRDRIIPRPSRLFIASKTFRKRLRESLFSLSPIPLPSWKWGWRRCGRGGGSKGLKRRRSLESQGWVGLGRKGALNKRRKPAATSFQGEEEYVDE